MKELIEHLRTNALRTDGPFVLRSGVESDWYLDARQTTYSGEGAPGDQPPRSISEAKRSNEDTNPAPIVDGVPPREKEVALRHEGASSESFLRRGGVVDRHGPLVGLDQACDLGEEGRLPTSARTHDAQPLVPIDGELHVRERQDLPEPLVNAADVDRRGGEGCHVAYEIRDAT